MSNIRSLDDYSKKNLSQDGKLTRNYTGGEHSGLSVENAEDPIENWPGAVNQQPDKEKVITNVIIYKNGFIVGNGPFRSLNEPLNAKFMKELKSGVTPKELQNGPQTTFVTVEDRRTENYEEPLSTNTLFSGLGNKLSNPSSSNLTNSSSVDLTQNPIILDNNKPTTVIQIRFHNGEKIRQRFNHDHTLGDLHLFFLHVAPLECNYRLVEGFPPTEISSSDSITLKEAGLLHTTITQIATE